MKTKRILSIFLLAFMLVTAMPMGAIVAFAEAAAIPEDAMEDIKGELGEGSTEKNYQIVKDLLRFRERYTPYILQMAHHAAKAYEPIVRPLAYEFPDCGYETESTMYLLGDKYLVVPMLEKGKTERTVTLPRGLWKESDGSILQGGQPVTLHFPLEKVYVFERME